MQEERWENILHYRMQTRTNRRITPVKFSENFYMVGLDIRRAWCGGLYDDGGLLTYTGIPSSFGEMGVFGIRIVCDPCASPRSVAAPKLRLSTILPCRSTAAACSNASCDGRLFPRKTTNDRLSMATQRVGVDGMSLSLFLRFLPNAQSPPRLLLLRVTAPFESSSSPWSLSSSDESPSFLPKILNHPLDPPALEGPADGGTGEP